MFTDRNRRRALEIIDRYPLAKSAILPLAHLAQDQDGHLSREAMVEIADLVGVTPAQIYGTCSFYTMFKLEPVGRFIVSVCTNVTCLVLGGPELYEHIRTRYATDDDVHVEEVECIAACDGAPCMQVNYDFHLALTPEAAEDLIERYKRGELVARTTSGTRRDRLEEGSR
jgi:NADH-quinone oxidoreductase subunit E